MTKKGNCPEVRNFDIVYFSGAKSDETNIYNQFDKPYYYDFFKKIVESSKQERDAFYRDYYFNISLSAVCPE